MPSHIDFGYPWYLTYGHLVVVAVLLPLFLLSLAKKWPVAPKVLLGVVLLWSLAAFVISRFELNVNGRMPLPTEAFFSSGEGRVLDMGAGTGRSTLMVLEARPKARVVALDLFGDSYQQHFGARQSGEQRLMANLRAAGVDGRAAVQAGDMRKLPFEPESFDAVVSSYAIDHLNSAGIRESLSEASRVLKPGGDFLLMVINKDPWIIFAWGPLAAHMGARAPERWVGLLRDAGFQTVERGTRPGTLYLLARKARGGVTAASQ